MDARSNTLATQFEQAVAEFAAAIEKCPDGHWTLVPAGSWTVAATALHVAGQFPLERKYIVAAAEGKAKLPLAGSAEVTTQQLIEGGVLIDHIKSHLPALRAAG